MSRLTTSAKRVLVTGGAGLIGSHLVDLLLQQGHRVKILDNLDPQTHPQGKPTWIPKDAEFIHGDLRDERAVSRALRDVDWVFHQAAFGGFTPALTQYMDVNATGTARLFEIIRAEGLPIEKIVAASSQAVYGEGLSVCAEHADQFPPMRSRRQLEQGQWEARCPICDEPMTAGLTPESAPKNGETIYALSKYAEERLTLCLGKQLGISTVALRYAVTYGPRQSVFNPYTGVVSIFSTRLLNNQPPVLYEDGQQSRDFLYVADNARANLFVMAHPETAGQVYNVGTGQPVTVQSLVEALAQRYEKAITPQLPGSFRPMDVRHFVHDAGKLRALGWQPEISLAEGLGHYVDWIQTLPSVTDYFAEALKKLEACQVVVSR